MKNILVCVCVAMLTASVANAAGGFKKQKFQEIVYFAHGGTGAGNSADNPAPFSSKDAYAIPANAVIEKAYAVVSVAITGAALTLDIGDDDDPDGFCADTNITAATPGMYCNDATKAGVYHSDGTSPKAKFYTAAGKEAKLTVSGTSSTGAMAVVVEGFLL